MREAIVVVGLALVLAGCLGGTGTAPGTGAPTTASDTPVPSPDATSTDDSTADDRPSETATDTITPTDGIPASEFENVTGTDCEERTVATTNPARASVTPGPLPDRPEELTRASVAPFVEAYEKAYKRNHGLERTTMQYEVYVEEVSVREVEQGYVVNVSAGYWYNAADVPSGTGVGTGTATETPTVIHADGPIYRALYLVTEDRLLRTSSLEHRPADPGLASTVECW